jgi:hypothetical protein
LAQQGGVAQRWRDHLIASPFGTIERATFSYGRPIGTSVPEPLGYQTVNFDPSSVGRNAWQIDAPLNAPAPVEYPSVNRRLKGDRQPVMNTAPAVPETLPQLQPVDAPAVSPMQPPRPAPFFRFKSTELDDIVPPVAQPAQPLPSAPVLQLEAAARPAVALHALAQPAAAAARHAPDDDDALLPDRPPEIPAAGERTTSLAMLSFTEDDPARLCG